MLDYQSYRGPDDRGTWSEADVTLGHLRLSIIDLSSDGHQPMLSHDSRFVLIFNGEIYNYIELKSELKSAGALFKTATDSEVIIEAYRKWGADCVSRFNGMWAFALFDRHDKTLFLSRDRFGVKPLFYRQDGTILRFASEMKALLTGGKGEPHWTYLYNFFDRRTPLGSDETVFTGIRHLRPGHSMVLTGGKMDIRRYWMPDPTRSSSEHSGDPARTLRELVTDAVRLRLRSDVPVGVCLSGGVDSSVIACTIASMGVKPETFSTVYAESECSEESFIDIVNRSIGAHSHKLTPSPDDFFPVMEQIVRHHDEPVRMPGVFSHWNVMQCASGHVTVLLDGQGADEIVGGYKEFYPSYLASLLSDMLLLRCPVGAWRDFQSCTAGLQQHLGASSPFVKEAVAQLLPIAVRRVVGRERAKQRLFTQEFTSQHARSLGENKGEQRLLRQFSSRLDREMWRMFTETNLPMLLRYEDRNSMAFSLEARVPFLDYRVVEFCQSLDYRTKIKGYTTKNVLREAFADLLPPAVVDRKDKKGFPTPLARWLSGPLQIEMRRRLSDSPLYDQRIIDRAEVMTLIDQHTSGAADHERHLFRLLTIDMWLRQYVTR